MVRQLGVLRGNRVLNIEQDQGSKAPSTSACHQLNNELSMYIQYLICIPRDLDQHIKLWHPIKWDLHRPYFILSSSLHHPYLIPTLSLLDPYIILTTSLHHPYIILTSSLLDPYIIPTTSLHHPYYIPTSSLLDLDMLNALKAEKSKVSMYHPTSAFIELRDPMELKICNSRLWSIFQLFYLP